MAGLGFAREQLEKQGWKEGKGLGKEEDGIKEAIKVGIKNDTQGVGYKISEQFTFHWWDHVFNKAAKSIVVSEKEDGIEVSKSDSKYLPISTQRPNKHSEKPLLYGRFVKASTSSKVKSESDESDSDIEKDFSSEHAEDIVFKKCGGRTAHKGARHGLKLNGKLKRIEEHDKVAMSEPCSRSASPTITKQQDMVQNAEHVRKLLRSEKEKMSYSDSEECVKRKKKKKRDKVYYGGIAVDEESSSKTERKKGKKKIADIVHDIYKDREDSVHHEESCFSTERKKRKKSKSMHDNCKEEEATVDEESCFSSKRTKKTEAEVMHDILKEDKVSVDEGSSFSVERKKKKNPKPDVIQDICEDKEVSAAEDSFPSSRKKKKKRKAEMACDKDLTQASHKRKSGNNTSLLECAQSELKLMKKKGRSSDENSDKDDTKDLEQKQQKTAEKVRKKKKTQHSLDKKSSKTESKERKRKNKQAKTNK